MATNIIKTADSVSARMAECYATINGTRYNFAQIVNAEFKTTKKKGSIPRMGAIMDGHRSYGMEGTFSGTMIYNQSVTRQMVQSFKNSGVDTYFDVQVINDDPASEVGRMSITYFGCNTDEDILSKFNAATDSEYLDEDISGTFEDFNINQGFSEYPGFRA